MNPAAAADEQTLLLLAEQLVLGKRTVEGEGVRVRVFTEQDEHQAAIALTSERLDVTRVPIGRIVDVAPPVREEDGVTIIPVMAETVVLETRLVLKEELHIRRIPETTEHRQTILLRRQRAEVERLPPTGRPISSKTEEKDSP